MTGGGRHRAQNSLAVSQLALALVLLVIVAAIWAPATLEGPALSAIAPFGALLGITALGQMLVLVPVLERGRVVVRAVEPYRQNTFSHERSL